MHLNSPRSMSSVSNAEFLRRYGRLMLRDARSDHPSRSLPVIRRIHAAGVVPLPRVTDLYRARATLQLKHMLRTLAIELGYSGWEVCKNDVDRRPSAIVDRYRMDIGAFGDWNQVWFASEAAALQWQRESGGRVVVYGSQAAVLTG
ncbi:MAG TPA: hypothetical protein VEC06_16115 [Paucimonas sp.]|nr:hypothetical protein [Paucimonas sp.]